MTFEINLFPEKKPVQTSLGALFIRRARASDLAELEGNNLVAIGTKAIQLLTSKFQDKKDRTALADAEFSSLVEADFQVLVSAIATQNHWGKLDASANIADLGQLIKDEIERAKESFRKQMKDMSKVVDTSYHFMPPDKLDEFKQLLTRASAISQPQHLASQEWLDSTKVGSALKDSLTSSAHIQAGITSASDHVAAMMSKTHSALTNIPELGSELHLQASKACLDSAKVGGALKDSLARSAHIQAGIAFKASDHIAEMMGKLPKLEKHEVNLSDSPPLPRIKPA
jgi:hypothetical protein